MVIHTTFGDNIKFLRQSMGMSRERLAKILGILPSAISDYEDMAGAATPDVLERMAALFNVPSDLLTKNKLKGAEKYAETCEK